MDESSIAVRYAKALFESASDKKVVDLVLADLSYLVNLLKESKEFRDFIDSPVIQVSQKLGALDTLFKDNTNELTYRFLCLLVSNRREKYLGAVARMYESIYRKEQGIIRVSLSTVKKPDEQTKNIIKELLGKKYQAKIDLHTITDESLIGGFVLRVDDDLFDGSVTTQLRNIRRELEQTILN